MIKQLRKKHLQIWLVLAIFLPIAIIVAYISVPKKVTQDLLQPPSKTSVSQVKLSDSLNNK